MARHSVRVSPQIGIPIKVVTCPQTCGSRGGASSKCAIVTCPRMVLLYLRRATATCSGNHVRFGTRGQVKSAPPQDYKSQLY